MSRTEIKPRAAGANMSVDILLHGDEMPSACYYENLQIEPAHPTLSRIDTVTTDGRFSRVWRGTPERNAHLGNRQGACVPVDGWGEEVVGWVWVTPGCVTIREHQIWLVEFEIEYNRIQEEVRRAVDAEEPS